MKIIILIENEGVKPLRTEHGLSVYIEYENTKYLLDTGNSNLFLKNAKQLGVDLAQIDIGVLSHAHQDHSGGYMGFFQSNDKAKVYARDKGVEPCFIKIGCLKKYVGIPKKTLEQYGNRFEFINGKYELNKGVWLIPHTTHGLEKRGKMMHMARKVDDKIMWDDFSHEQSLIFECTEGIVVLNSCSHGGGENIIKEAQEAFPNKKILALIGGLHLMGIGGVNTMKQKPDEVRDLANHLNELNVGVIYTGHCTGNKAFTILKEELGEKVQHFNTGTVLKFE